jgi:hypothetical protein
VILIVLTSKQNNLAITREPDHTLLAVLRLADQHKLMMGVTTLPKSSL